MLVIVPFAVLVICLWTGYFLSRAGRAEVLALPGVLLGAAALWSLTQGGAGLEGLLRSGLAAFVILPGCLACALGALVGRRT